MCSRKAFCAGAQGMARPRPPPLATKATGIPRTDCCLPSVQGADHGDRRLFLRPGTQKDTGGRGTCQKARKGLSRKRTPAPAGRRKPELARRGLRPLHGYRINTMFSAPYQCCLIRGQPFFRAGYRPATETTSRLTRNAHRHSRRNSPYPRKHGRTSRAAQQPLWAAHGVPHRAGRERHGAPAPRAPRHTW